MSNYRDTVTLADLSHLGNLHTGGTLLPGELLDIITDAITNNPRSRQIAIGPSELGTPCPRRLAYRMAGTSKVNDRPGWKPTVGTAVHAHLADIFTAAGGGRDRSRWLVETRVSVGEVGGQEVVGSADLFDIITGTVIDFKIVGTASLRAKKATNDPGRQYQTQLHLYGAGFARRGLPVNRVAILALPQNGELGEHWWWAEPYDAQVAADALARADTIAALVAAGGLAAAAALPTADAFCTYCPWYRPGSTDLTQACPGHAQDQTPPATVADALTGSRQTA